MANMPAVFTNWIHFLYLSYVMFIAKRLTRGAATRIAVFTDSSFLLQFKCNKLSPLAGQRFGAMREAGILPVVFITSEQGADDYANIPEGDRQHATVVYPHGLTVASRKETWVITEYPLVVEHIAPESRDKYAAWILYGFVILIWILKFSRWQVFPKDDLLRHIVAYKWGFDYNIPYMAVTTKPTFDYYIGFDWFFGHVHQILGDYSLLLPQVISLALLFAAVSKMMEGADPSIKVIALTLMVQLIWGRIMTGRPSLVVSSMSIVLYAYRDQLAWYLKAALGAIMASFYYMFFLYLGPLALIDRKLLPVLAAGIMGWWFYSHGHYFSEIYHVMHSLSNQNMQVRENDTILVFFATAWIFAVPFILHFRKDIKNTALILFYCIANQVRYVETIVPLMLSYMKHIKVRVSMTLVAGVAVYLITHIGGHDNLMLRDIPAALPPGSRVLADNMNIMYQMIYRRQDIKVAPCYAYGWTESRVQEILLDMMANGHIDCGSNTLSKFDYLVEKSLRGGVPQCLTLVMTEQGERLWKIRKQ